MRVVFIRHLCTPGNEKRQYIGRTDEDLSERVAEEFRQRQEKSTGGLYPSAQYIITSPLKRCIQTAGLIYPGMEIVTEPMLRECDFGEYEQKTYEDLKNEPEYIRWLESGGMTAFPAFVVHGGTIMAVLSELAEDKHEFYHWQVENGGGYVAEVSGEEWRNSRKVLRVTQRI